MKHGVKLTRKQKILLKSRHLIPENWLRVMDTPEKLQIVSKKSGRTKIIMKEE